MKLGLLPNKGFQSFVDESSLLAATSTVGTPGPGVFYSSIIKRASIPDISANFKTSMGIERITTQQVVEIQNEIGSGNQKVFGVLNDDKGLIRLAGSWSSGGAPQYGQYITGGTSVNDYLEITFYGTGLNMLSLGDSGYDIRASVDGGSEGSNIQITNSAVLHSRNYSPNQVRSVTSGLSLGVHTVKLRAVTACPLIYGFEILNESTTLKVNAGTAFLPSGKKVVSAQQSPAYNSSFETGTLGTRGGRVLAYLKSDGTVGKAVTPTGSSQLNSTSADHSNEDLIRTYHFREFAAGRTDDFSRAFTAGGSLNSAFTLDDGTTTLIGSGVGLPTGSPESIATTGGIGSFITIYFVGTGLDITRIDGGTGTITPIDVYINGTNTFSITGAEITTGATTPIVSGLPYGTHTVKFLRTANGTSSHFGIKAFKVYGPKKPVLPTGSIELADYNIAATYVANSTTNVDAIGTGVLRKIISIREAVYVGTWSTNLAVADIGGQNTNSTTNGDYWQYIFYGTGFEFRFSNAAAASTWQFTVDSTTNLTTLSGSPVMTSYGPSVTSFTASTGTLVINTTASTGTNGVTLSGLTLGLHTVRLTKTAGTGPMSSQSLDIITPIHSPKSNFYSDIQNTLPVGSCALSDNRVTTPIKDALPAQKGWAQAYGVSSDPTTTSTSFVPMPDMSLTFKASSNLISISYVGELYNAVANNNIAFQVYLNGTAIDTQRIVSSPATSYSVSTTLKLVWPVSPGVNKVEIYWRSPSGSTTTAGGIRRNLTVEEK